MLCSRHRAVSERNGWNALSAVSEGKVIELDDDIASRWGPKVVEFLEAIATAVEQRPAFPVTLQTPTGDLVLESQPTRILSYRLQLLKFFLLSVLGIKLLLLMIIELSS
ncbi:MAG: hypothetical protein Ct9H90mP5_08900 [Acidimicrobiaceae bacterium]|nr:MAG: hypothetical protein Ct9H90mP5_08900 [Acidimicrobiaceae bacterium]